MKSTQLFISLYLGLLSFNSFSAMSSDEDTKTTRSMSSILEKCDQIKKTVDEFVKDGNTSPEMQKFQKRANLLRIAVELIEETNLQDSLEETIDKKVSKVRADFALRVNAEKHKSAVLYLIAGSAIFSCNNLFLFRELSTFNQKIIPSYSPTTTMIHNFALLTASVIAGSCTLIGFYKLRNAHSKLKE